MANVKRIKLPPGLGVYVFIDKARKPPPGSQGEPKFSIVLLYPKSKPEVLADLRRAMEEVAQLEWGPKGLDILKRMKYPVPGDGDKYYAEDPEKHDPIFKGMLYVRASSTRKPGVVDSSVQPVFDLNEDAYSGCTFRAAVAVSTYDKGGNKGVGVFLNNLMVVEKGPKLAGGKPPEEDFAEFKEAGGNGSKADVSDL